jgi:ferredoxin
MKVVVDRAKCGGMGICEGIDPERFQVQGDDKTQVLQDVVVDQQARELVQEAVDMCPTEALSIVD